MDHQGVLGSQVGQHAADLARPAPPRRRPSPGGGRRPGWSADPSRLKTVRSPSSRRTGITSRIAGWSSGAKRKAMPTSSRARPAISGETSIGTPRAASTSALPGAAGDRAVAMLGDRHAGRRRHQRRGGRDVEGAAAVAAGAAGVDHAGAVVRDRGRPAAHGGGGAGRSPPTVLALHPQGDQQRRLERLADQTVHQLAEQLLGLRAGRGSRRRQRGARTARARRHRSPGACGRRGRGRGSCRSGGGRRRSAPIRGGTARPGTASSRWRIPISVAVVGSRRAARARAAGFPRATSRLW